MAWRWSVKQRAYERDVGTRTVCRWQQGALAKAFAAWGGFVVRTRRHRVIVARCVARMRCGRLARALGAWVEHTAERGRVQRRGRRAVAYMANRQATRGWTRWVEWLRERRRLRCLMRRIVSRWCNSKMVRAVRRVEYPSRPSHSVGVSTLAVRYHVSGPAGTEYSSTPTQPWARMGTYTRRTGVGQPWLKRLRSALSARAVRVPAVPLKPPRVRVRCTCSVSHRSCTGTRLFGTRGQ